MTPPLKDLSLSWFGDEFDIALLDLYRGDVATKITDATHLMNQLDFTGALRDIRATVKHLREKEGSTKVSLRATFAKSTVIY